ncbi:hypothetical protein V496_02011 [Pseudogymnoascus sp. VKM F-4515 (FW-2607)]|nr:hypothetical protein V496_02011 [Pseudogymnoascus sp. VKM F-4515 (FW-2607)]
MEILRDRLDTQDYDTLLLLLYSMYDHVVLETSWAAWAGAITAIELLEDGSKQVAKCIRMEEWILDQFASKQREIIGQGVSEGQEENAHCVLGELTRYHKGHQRREEKRHLEWNHLERKKKHINNLAEVLKAILHLHVQKHLCDYKVVAELMLLEDEGPLGRHADFHGGVQRICHPSTCRHTADANDIFRALEEICINLISEGEDVEAREAIRVFERVPRYYKHIAAQRLERVRSMFSDKWPHFQESDDESDDKSEDESEDESEDDVDL